MAEKLKYNPLARLGFDIVGRGGLDDVKIDPVKPVIVVEELPTEDIKDDCLYQVTEKTADTTMTKIFQCIKKVIIKDGQEIEDIKWESLSRIELTEQQYVKLSYDQKNDGTLYVIIDELNTNPDWQNIVICTQEEYARICELYEEDPQRLQKDNNIYVVEEEVVSDGRLNNIIVCTKAEYDAMEEHDSKTLYIVKTIGIFLGDNCLANSTDDGYTKTEMDAKLSEALDEKAEEVHSHAMSEVEGLDEALEESKDYNNEKNKPQINGTTLQGNKTADDLGLVQKSLFLNTLFPKGHIIMTYNKVSPATYIGGTWELIDEGYYPVATVKDIIDEQTERFKQAGLPNITGSLSSIYLKGDRNTVSKKGALKESTFVNNKWGGTNSGDATNLNELVFDASDSNSIYGASDTVQPKSVLFYIWVRTDDDILTYNFTNISFRASDFHVSETGQVSSALYPESGEIIQTIRSAFDPNAKYVGTVWRKFIDGIYFSSGNTFEITTYAWIRVDGLSQEELSALESYLV